MNLKERLKKASRFLKKVKKKAAEEYNMIIYNILRDKTLELINMSYYNLNIKK